MPELLIERIKRTDEKSGPGRPKHASAQIEQLLREFERGGQEWRYGYDLHKKTGITPGTLYPILKRLQDDGILEGKWLNVSEGKPPRRMYRITDAFKV